MSLTDQTGQTCPTLEERVAEIERSLAELREELKRVKQDRKDYRRLTKPEFCNEFAFTKRDYAELDDYIVKCNSSSSGKLKIATHETDLLISAAFHQYPRAYYRLLGERKAA